MFQGLALRSGDNVLPPSDEDRGRPGDGPGTQTEPEAETETETETGGNYNTTLSQLSEDGGDEPSMADLLSHPCTHPTIGGGVGVWLHLLVLVLVSEEVQLD